MNAIAPIEGNLVFVPEHELVEALARTPLDQYLIWNGRSRAGRPNSILTQALTCIHEVWEPLSFRSFLQRAARLSGSYGLRPEAVKKSIWSHQAATPASYFLVRATGGGAYTAVTDVPRPSSWSRPVRAGEIVMSASGRLDTAAPAQTPLSSAA